MINAPSTTAQTVFKINRDYGNTQLVSVPQEIELTVPLDSANIITPLKSDDHESYLKIQFLSKDKQVAENMTLRYIKIQPNSSTEIRLTKLKGELVSQLNNYTSAAMHSIEEIKIGANPALVVKAQNSNYFLVLIGILNPNSQHCAYAIINIDPTLSEVKNLEATSQAGAALSVIKTFHFGRELM